MKIRHTHWLFFLVCGIVVHAAAQKTYVPTYIVACTVQGNGAVTPIHAAVKQGGSQTLKFTPAAQHLIQDVTVNGVSVMNQVAVTKSSGRGALKLENVQQHLQVVVTFVPALVITVQKQGGGFGLITPEAANITVTPGSRKTFQFLAQKALPSSVSLEEAPGYIQEVTLDGVSVMNQVKFTKQKNGLPKGAFTLDNIQTNHTLMVTFAQSAVPLKSSVYTIRPGTSTGHGTIEPAIVKAEKNSVKTLKFTPDADYRLQRLRISGLPYWNVMADVTSRVIIDRNGVGYYALTVTGEHQILADFALDPAQLPTPTPIPTPRPTSTPAPGNDITIINLTPGWGSVAGTTHLTRSIMSTTLQIQPMLGYLIQSVVFDGASVMEQLQATINNGASFRIVNDAQDHTLQVAFAPEPTPTPIPPTPTRTPTPGPVYHAITIQRIGNGTTNPASNRNVLAGNSLCIWFYPNSGANLSDVLLDGASVMENVKMGTANLYYDLVNIRAPHTVQAVFGALPTPTPAPTPTPLPTPSEAQRMVTITSAGDGSGTTTPGSPVYVTVGGTLTLTITCDEDSYVDNVTLDGVSVKSQVQQIDDYVWRYVLTNITAHHTIRITYATY